MGSTAKRSTGLKTREAILQASRHLFLHQGYHATGMREIARKSGISLASVYNHFSSKEEIFAALLSEMNIYQVMAESLQQAKGESVAETLESGFVETMSALRGREEFVLLVFIDILEFQARHAATLAAGTVPKFVSFFQHLYQQGHLRRELRDVPPILVARAYIGLLFSTFVLQNVVKLFAEDKVTLPLRVENLEKGLVDVLLHGILKEGPPEGPSSEMPAPAGPAQRSRARAIPLED